MHFIWEIKLQNSVTFCVIIEGTMQIISL